jgi:hypothetical protein
MQMNPSKEEDPGLVRIPVEAKAESSAGVIVSLKKRSPGEVAAYKEGFLAGLKAAMAGIEKSIEDFDLLAKTML